MWEERFEKYGREKREKKNGKRGERREELIGIRTEGNGRNTEGKEKKMKRRIQCSCKGKRK